MLNSIVGFLGNGAGGGGSSYESIATVVGTGASGTITFSSIPSTYKALQIRAISRSTFASAGAGNTKIQFNGDTGANYAWHNLFGDGTTVTANGNSAQTGILIDKTTPMSAELPVLAMAVLVIDIADYASTSKAKTLRSFVGYNGNTGANPEQVRLNSGLWTSTSAISSITLTAELGSYITTSSFALYGIKG